VRSNDCSLVRFCFRFCSYLYCCNDCEMKVRIINKTTEYLVIAGTAVSLLLMVMMIMMMMTMK